MNDQPHPLHALDDDRTDRMIPTKTRYAVLAWLCVSALVAYICRNSIGVAESTIRAELELSEEAMAWVMSGFFLSYALGQIPMGWLGQKFGSRVSIPLFAVVWSASTGVMGLASGWISLLAARLVNGSAQAGLFPCCTRTVSVWLPGSQRAIASGALASFMSIGGAVGVAITGTMIPVVGWRWTFAWFSCLGILWAMGFFWWFREYPSQHTSVNDAERELIGTSEESNEDQSTVPTPWTAIYSSPVMWWICGQQFCRAAGQIFFASWFATYLQETRNISVQESGLLNSLPLIAIVLGSFIGGGVSDLVLMRTGSRWLARCGVAVVSMFLCSGFVFGAYFIEQPLLAVLTISMGTFCAAIGGPSGYSLTIDMGGRNVAIVFATMNMVGNLGAFSFIRLVPEIIERTGNWNGVLVLFGVLYFVAGVFWLLINPKGTILDHSLVKSRSW